MDSMLFCRSSCRFLVKAPEERGCRRSQKEDRHDDAKKMGVSLNTGECCSGKLFVDMNQWEDMREGNVSDERNRRAYPPRELAHQVQKTIAFSGHRITAVRIE